MMRRVKQNDIIVIAAVMTILMMIMMVMMLMVMMTKLETAMIERMVTTNLGIHGGFRK